MALFSASSAFLFSSSASFLMFEMLLFILFRVFSVCASLATSCFLFFSIFLLIFSILFNTACLILLRSPSELKSSCIMFILEDKSFSKSLSWLNWSLCETNWPERCSSVSVRYFIVCFMKSSSSLFLFATESIYFLTILIDEFSQTVESSRILLSSNSSFMVLNFSFIKDGSSSESLSRTPSAIAFRGANFLLSCFLSCSEL